MAPWRPRALPRAGQATRAAVLLLAAGVPKAVRAQPQSANLDPYDCQEGYGWPDDKKSWCCKNKGVGCADGDERLSGGLRLQQPLDFAEHVCQGEDEEWGNCGPRAPCVECTPSDCVFAQWGAWYDGDGCIGLQFRHRDIEVANNECGKPCHGARIESVKHLKASCVIAVRDCIFQPWAEWSSCQTVMDQADRTRGIAQYPTGGGAPCTGTLRQTRPCGGPDRQDCQFAPWREWTQCSATCGEGRHSRMRRVEVEAAHGGATCNAELLEVKPCMTEECPKEDCLLSAWSSWSVCDMRHTQRVRNRQVLHAPRGAGQRCPERLMETGPCEGPQRTDCEVTDWTAWVPCTQTCGGGQTFRERVLVRPNSNGGSCPMLPLKVVEACNTGPCEAVVDCELEVWSDWSACSTTFGQGSRSRTRGVARLSSKGGAPCAGAMSELVLCEGAPGAEVNCVWGDWEAWTECSYSCGGGTMRRSREIARPASLGGAPCPPLSKSEVAPCNTQQCDDGCVDGKWGDWMPWTNCSTTCGGGFVSRTRAAAVQPNKCGASLTGLPVEYAACQGQPACAQDVDCRLSEWGPWTSCTDNCSGVRERFRDIAVYASGKGKPCTGVSLKAVEPCAGDPEQCAGSMPIDCKVGDWGVWTQCTAACDGGQRERRRGVLQLATLGGKPCEDRMVVTEPCNLQPCNSTSCTDCRWGEWWAWSDCEQCGGQRTRTRVVETLANACGRPCDLRSAKETSNCTSSCEASLFCAWSEWSPANCTGGCGQRAATRSRSLKLVPSAADFLFKAAQGTPCQGSQLSLVPCPQPGCEPKCQPKHCQFGDWSNWTAPTCLGLCERQRAIAVMNNECGEPCSGHLAETKACAAECEPAKDCVLSTWSGWTACDALLTGQRYRSRTVLQEPEYGGLPCVGHLNETRACNIPDPDPCQMEPWSSWTSCSHSCGGGMMLRKRGVAATALQGGEQCRGSLQQLQSCGTQPCVVAPPKDCRFGDWSAWSECNADNQRERTRSIAQPSEAGGSECDGSLHETRTCVQKAVDCEISPWTNWDECDRSCGSGQTHRQRQILSFPEHGGKLCPDALIQTKGCNKQPCEVRDCLVSGWMEWSSCSTTCGQGMQSRHREIVRLRGEGGAGCFFELGETRQCPGQPTCEVDDCQLSDWSAWSLCSASCGPGSRARARVVLGLPDAGGTPCPAEVLKEVETCNVVDCHEACFDGYFGVWGDWSPCSVSCAGGVTFRQRKMEKMANSCGKEPEGKDREEDFCNLDVPCEEPRPCLFEPWSEWSECSASCNGMKHRAREVAEYGRGTGVFCLGALAEVWPCNPGQGEKAAEECSPLPVIDCTLSAWEPWSPCGASCGGGQHLRSRTIVQRPLNGGKPCGEALTEIRECARNSCAGPGAVDCTFGDWGDWQECSKCDGERKRIRKIVAYAQNGGRTCGAFASEEVGQCPRSCSDTLYCGWSSWDPWSQCTSSCGTGGRRKRSRRLELSREPFRNDTGPHLDAADALGRFEVLYREAQDLESPQVQEVVLAFASGGLALLSAAFAVQAGRSALSRWRGGAPLDAGSYSSLAWAAQQVEAHRYAAEQATAARDLLSVRSALLGADAA